MRNLKKILALVLALIMSLSLMVTAGAKDFPDSDGITNDAYALAVDILSDLDVFNGDQNGNFNPTSDITRAEVAAIIYRIATGDVGVDGYKTYAPYNQFKDIDVEDWYAGYVTYCANAGYIKGRNTGNFDAKDPVTGYEVLAMILRAVGYDKNNEFVGSNWQLNTASIATEKGVLANVLKDGTVRLSDPASRQVVAEMLFRAIQIPQVTWNAATLSYIDNGETLAKQNLGMESVTGVIMANEWANINEGGTVVLPEGQTQMLPFGETKNLTLDVDTDLDAVGQTYTAYIQNDTRVLGKLEYREDLNTVAFNDGAGITVAKLAGKESLKLGGETSYFLNYSEDLGVGHYSSHVIRYAIAETSCTATNGWKEYITSLVKKSDGTDVVAGHSYETRKITINNVSTDCYVVTIQPNNWITDEDYEIMQRIFYSADRLNTTIAPENVQDFVVVGEVYVGTNSTVDVSDWNPNTNSALSWAEFVDTYLNPTDIQYIYTDCGNGESLRIIDNDDDGVAEYVFKVEYWQDKAVDTEKDELVYYALDLDDYYYSTFEEEIAVGDVVNYTSIDGRVTVYKANVISGKVLEKNFENETILTTADDTNYGQSDIYNNTLMLDEIMNTEDETEYHFYLDEFGYIRTYELAQGTEYALITEIYNTTGQAYNYVNTNVYTAEVVIGDEEAHEYRIANNGNPFISAFAWTSRISNYYYTDGDLNYLQPAIAHLGINGLNAVAGQKLYTGATVGKAYNYVSEDWSRGVFTMSNLTHANTFWGLTGDKALAGGPDYGVFNYGAVNETWLDTVDGVVKGGAVDRSFSFTNVAIYGLGDNDTISLRTASKLKIDKNGDQLYYWQDTNYYIDADDPDYPWLNKPADLAIGIGRKQMTLNDWIAAYAASNNLDLSKTADKKIATDAAEACTIQVYDVDYVQLSIDDATNDKVSAGKAHYYIDDNYGQNYHALTNGYVNATVETEFYIAMPNKVLHYVGYDKLPTIDISHIRAAYAVASNTYQDSTDHDYWIANVIVIEVEDLDDPYDSVSLMYYNPNEVSGSVRNVRSLNNMWRTYQPDSDNEANIPVVPKTSNGGSAVWGNQSWTGSNYGFYEVYDSTYADGTLDAGDVKLLPALATTDWAGHGIYAGTIQRIYGLTSSEYIDVDFLGRDYTTDVEINDENVKKVPVTTSDSAVPIYRVNKNDTSDLRLGKRVASSDVQLGDQIILVYSKSGTLAYIVDLGTRLASNGSVIYQAPTWLWTNYNAIVGQGNAADGIVFTSNFSEYVKIEDGEAVAVAFPVADKISFSGSGKLSTTNFNANTGLTYNNGKTATAAIPDGYSLEAVESADKDCYTVDITGWPTVIVNAVGDYDLRTGVILNLIFEFDSTAPGAENPIIANAKEEGSTVPSADWKIVGIAQAGANAAGRSADPTLPEVGDDARLYFDVKSSYDVDSVTITGPADIAGTYEATDIVGNGPFGSDAVAPGFVRWYIEFTMPADVIELTINVTNDDVVITVPANTTTNASILKNAPLSGKTIVLSPATGYNWPASVSITVGERALTVTTDFTYDNADGTITFTAKAGDADGPIVITGTAAEKTRALNLSGTDEALANVKVMKGDTEIAHDRGAWSWTLLQGVDYTLEVTAPAQAGKRAAVVVTNEDTHADLDLSEDDGVYTAAIAGGTSALNLSVSITYVDVVNLTVTVAGAEGATVGVTGGNASRVGTTNVWTVDKGTTPTITVTPASGRLFKGAPTSTGVELTFVQDANAATYSKALTSAQTADNATIAITCTAYMPDAVTFTASSPLEYANDGKVTLEPNTDKTKVTGKLSVTVPAGQTLEETSTGSGTYKAEYTVAVPTVEGYTVGLSVDGADSAKWDDGKVVVSGASATSAELKLDVIVTLTPEV